MYGRRTQAANGVGDVQVHLSAVSLDADVVCRREAGFLAKQIVELINRRAVALVNLHEAGLGSSGSHSTAESEFLALGLNVLKISGLEGWLVPGSFALKTACTDQVLNPLACSATDGNFNRMSVIVSKQELT